jgi:hypothetical protein
MEKLKSITVAKLIELLQDQDPDAKVVFSTNYGDYSRTEQALPLKGEIEEVFVEPSAYSNSGFAVAKDDGYNRNEPDEDGYAAGPEDEQQAFLRIA